TPVTTSAGRGSCRAVPSPWRNGGSSCSDSWRGMPARPRSTLASRPTAWSSSGPRFSSETGVLARGGQASLEIGCAKRPRLGDQAAGRVPLLPRVPEQPAAPASGVEIVDAPFLHRVLPVGHGLVRGVPPPARFVPQLERVEIKKGRGVVGETAPRHVLARHV